MPKRQIIYFITSYLTEHSLTSMECFNKAPAMLNAKPSSFMSCWRSAIDEINDCDRGRELKTIRLIRLLKKTLEIKFLGLTTLIHAKYFW